MTRTTFTDNKSTYEAALISLFAGKPEDTEAKLSKLFTPDFTLRANDETYDFPAFVAHIKWLREILPETKVTITQFLRDGNQLAERHLGSQTTKEGKVLTAETFQFASVAEDGRIQWIVENVKQGQ